MTTWTWVYFLCFVGTFVLLCLSLQFRLETNVEKHTRTLNSFHRKLALQLDKTPGRSCRIDYPLYYINLERNKYRRMCVERELLSVGFKEKSTRVIAVDGRNLPDNFVNDFEDMTAGEIGCTLSHLKVIEQASAEFPDQPVLVCEDDVSFEAEAFWKKSLTEMVVELEQHDPEWHILVLYSDRTPKDKLGKPGFHRAVPGCCTVSYLIHPRGVRNVLSKTRAGGQWRISRKHSDMGQADHFLYNLGFEHTWAVNQSLMLTRPQPSEILGHSETDKSVRNNIQILDYWTRQQ